jgi:signal transduction histidine kinase
MQSEESIISVIVFTCALAAAFGGVFIIFIIRDNNRQIKEQAKQKEEVLTAVIGAEKKERDRIFHNLHDQVNPTIRQAARNLRWHQRNLKKNIPVTESDFEMDLHILETALEDIKSAIHDVLPTFLLDFGLLTTLEKEFAENCKYHSVKGEFVTPNDIPEKTFEDKNKLLNAYRLVNAVLDNVFQHTGCTICKLDIGTDSEKIIICFEHDGIGISNEDAIEYSMMENKIGLKSIRVREKMLEATVTYHKGEPSTIKIEIPV